MATTNEYIEYVCEQIKGVGEIRYKKMFGTEPKKLDIFWLGTRQLGNELCIVQGAFL